MKKTFTLQADLDTHFDKVVASFDWRGLEAARGKHPVIEQLFNGKLLLEASTRDTEVEVEACKTQMKFAIRSMIDSPEIYQAVTKAAPSLSEPLADIKQAHPSETRLKKIMLIAGFDTNGRPAARGHQNMGRST